MVQFVLLVLILATISIASWASGMAMNVLVGTNDDSMKMKVRQYLNVSTGFYLVLQPDCNLILYNHSQPVMTTNSSCSQGALAANSTIQLAPGTGSELDLSISQLVSTVNSTTDFNYTYISSFWTYKWAAPNPQYPYMILRENGSCDFYDWNSNLLLGYDYTLLPEANRPMLKLYSALPNASEGSIVPNIAYPFPPELAWEPPSSLNGFPYLPAGYYLSQYSKLQTMDQRFVLTLSSGCNLQARDTTKNGSEGLLIWESGPSIVNRTIVLPSDCELKLQQDGRLVIRNTTSGKVYWNSTSSRNDSVSWILRLSSMDGSLSISDIENSANVLWSNYGPNQANKTTTWIVVGVIMGVSALAMAGLVILYFCARTYILDPAEKAFRQRLKENGGRSQMRYSQAKIKQATNNFKNIIGSGGFGDVFYGKMSDGEEIAAKVLSAESHQSKQEFYNEIELLSVVHHKYLVSLLGYRCTRQQQILVYEFMSGGDLRHRLQGESALENPLDWRQRTTIALQVAEGLEYLHDKCSPSIIHRDVKSTNILLTDTLVAKVADFGLSKLRTKDQEGATHVTTVVKGTPGYLDPEYHETGMLTDKSDVYAFGIVLMEILTGQHQMYIAHRVAEAWRLERVDELPDPNLGGDYDKGEFVSLVELSLWCTRKGSGERPFMRQVVQRLREMGLAPSESLQPVAILGDEGQQVMALDMEFEISEEFARDTLPFSRSSSRGMSSEIWGSSLQFRQSSRSEER